jgi:hypothetical protein
MKVVEFDQYSMHEEKHYQQSEILKEKRVFDAGTESMK